MAASSQLSHPRMGNSLAQITEAFTGNQPIPVANHDQGRHSNSFQLALHIELFHHAEAMGNDSLIRLPASTRDKMEERPRLLPTAEKKVEKLINKWTVRRKR